VTGAAATRIPGLLTPDQKATDARRRSHAQALAILDDHYATGRPFALYFRTFSFTRLVGDNGSGEGTSYLQNTLLQALRRVGLGLVMVQDPSELAEVLHQDNGFNPFAAETPAIRLADNRWTEGVAELVARAELIVSELGAVSHGTTKELEICQETARADRVVAVLAETFGDHPLPRLDEERIVRALLRAVHANEIDLNDPLATFGWRDLVDRMMVIAQMPVEERLSLLESGRMDQRVPISFSGLAEGYSHFAALYRRAGHHLGAVLAYTKASQVAQHTGDPGRALRWALDAAAESERGVGREKMTATLALAEELLIQLRQTAANTSEVRDAETTLAMGRANLLFEAGQEDEGRTLLTNHLDQTTAAGDHLNASRLLERLTREALGRGSLLEAMNRAQAALNEARAAGDQTAIAAGLTFVGRCYAMLGEPRLAADSFNEAIALFPRGSPPEVAWETFMFFGQLVQASGLGVSPRPLFEAAVAIAQQLGLKAEENDAKRAVASIPLSPT